MNLLQNTTTGAGAGGNVTFESTGVNESDSEGPFCGVFFFLVYGPLYGLVSIFGVIGNSLSFAVLHKFSRDNVATYLLKSLAVIDNLFLIVASSVQMYQAMTMYFLLLEHIEPVYPYLQTYAWPLTHMCQMGTVYMTVLIGLNRYIAVCRPLHAPTLCTKRKVQLQLGIVSTAIVCYNLPRFFEYRMVDTVSRSNSTSNGTAMFQPAQVNRGLGIIKNHVTSRVNSQLSAADKTYNLLYEQVAYCVFVFLVPLLTLLVLNLYLVLELRRARRSREAITSHSSQEENNVTLVMIVIILSFIVCQTPASINQILYYLLDPEHKDRCTGYMKFYHLSNLLVLLNSAINFVIYCLFRRQFQQELLALFCPTRRNKLFNKRRSVMHSSHSATSRADSRGGRYKRACADEPGHQTKTAAAKRDDCNGFGKV